MNRLLAAFFAAALASTAGCGPQIVLKYEPAAKAAMPEAASLRLHVTRPENAYGSLVVQGPGYKPGLGGSLEEAVRRALAAELGVLGFQLVDDRAIADAVASSSIEEAQVVWPGGIKTRVDGVIRILLTIKDRTGRGLWEGELRGAGRGYGGPAYIGTGPRDAMNAALASALRKIGPMFTDHSVVARIRGEGAPAARAPQPGPAAAAGPPRSDIDDLPKASAVRRAHAVVIGIERYRERLPSADFAAADARLAAEYFKRVLGVPAANVALLTDERATNVDFQKHFERWLPNRVKAGDEVYVYFSGHGSPNPTTGEAYMVPYDGDPTYLEQTGYPVRRMFDQLAKLPAGKIVVAMDSCFSGSGGRSVLAKGARPLVAVVAAAALPSKLTVIAASAGDQISNSYQEKGHGLFTYYFLKGLKEKGPDLKAVYGYLKPEVARVAREQYNADQDPQWREGK